MNKIDQNFAFQHQALNLRAHRQEVLASNIANADTPHYKARDFDFASALADARAGRSEAGLAMSTTSARHINAAADAGPVALRYRNEYQSAVDGNTVDMEVERSAFAENAMRYEASITFITGKFRTLNSAMAPAQ